MASTRQLLLDTAVRHLEALGWEGTQIPAIADEVHVARSSVYHFFGSREGLLAAATAERYRRSLLAENTTPVDDAAECSSEQEFLEFLTGQLKATLKSEEVAPEDTEGELLLLLLLLLIEMVTMIVMMTMMMMMKMILVMMDVIVLSGCICGLIVMM